MTTVSTVSTESDVNENTLLRYAATLERNSEHPLAAAIVKGAQEQNIAITRADEFESVTGKGVQGLVEGHRVALGNLSMMQDIGVEKDPSTKLESIRRSAELLRNQGQTVMFVAIDREISGLSTSLQQAGFAFPSRTTQTGHIIVSRRDHIWVFDRPDS